MKFRVTRVANMDMQSFETFYGLLCGKWQYKLKVSDILNTLIAIS